jgi:hypothetical protein
MAQAQGIDLVAAIYEESTYGVEPGSPAGKRLHLTRFGLEPSRNELESATLHPARAMPKPSAGNYNVAGDLVAEIGAEWAGTLLKHSIGPVTTSGAGPYSHEIKIGALPVGLTVERDHGAALAGSGRFERFNGCRVGSWEVNVPVEGYVLYTVSLVGRDSAPYSAALDASYDDPGHTPFTSFDVSLIEEGGSGIAYVESARIRCANNLDESLFALGGGGKRRALTAGKAPITGELVLLLESYALIQKARDRTPTSFQLTLSRGDGLGSAGNESIDFLVEQALLELRGTPVEGDAGIKVTLPFRAYRDGADNGLVATVKNAVATV